MAWVDDFDLGDLVCFGVTGGLHMQPVRSPQYDSKLTVPRFGMFKSVAASDPHSD